MKSQSREIKRRLAAGETIEGEALVIGAPIFVRHRPRDEQGILHIPPGIKSCTIHFLGKRPRYGAFYTKRGVWLGRYVK